MAQRPANNNGDGDHAGSIVGRSDRAAQISFVSAVMAIAEADDILAGGDVAGGIGLYRAAIRQCPPSTERADFQLLLGGILFEQGDAAAAVTEFQAALAAGCRYTYEGWRRLGFAHAALGDYAVAREAMAAARDSGEDVAFATQALAIMDLARHGLKAALRTAEPAPAHAGAQAEYRCRLALLRADLQRLAGNRGASLTDLELAAETARTNGLDAELALWLAVLDHHFGRSELRPDIAAAFAAEPDHWATRAWQILDGAGTRDDLVQHLANQVSTQRAENLAIFDRYAGLQALGRGDAVAARIAFTAARTEPHTRWCADYHLAGVDLLQVADSIVP
nr:hypothetical protein [uncultured Dongia sp.]